MRKIKSKKNKQRKQKIRFQNIVETIGRTPLVKLNRIVTEGSADIYVKMESFNPGSSVKDRIGMAMIQKAEQEGILKEGMTIIESTSGNTGIALAMIAASKGYKCVLVMPESMSLERRALLKMLGAELVLTPKEKGMTGANEKANELLKERGGFQPKQFSNPSNPEIHKLTTGPEIIADLGDIHLEAFIAGVGTGGTVSGVGSALKEKYNCQIIAVEPTDSAVLSGGQPGPHMIQGIGAGFIPENYDSSVVDKIIKIENEVAFETSRQLALKEGIVAGISSGANVYAALETAKKLGKGKTIVTIICDTGERYISTPLMNR